MKTVLGNNLNEKDWQNRTQLLLGKEKLEKLHEAHILVAGLGGVGGYAVDQLARSGIGKLTLIDNDRIHTTNRNRQIVAFNSTEGKFKTEIYESRLKDINPQIQVVVKNEFLTEENIPALFDTHYDYVIDAIDTLTPKVQLLQQAITNKNRIISSMGSGGKMDPSLIRITDISQSHNCKLAYKVRKAIHKYGIYDGIKVVFSPEEVLKKSLISTDGSNFKRSIIGTISYMPAIFGCYIAAEIIKDIIE